MTFNPNAATVYADGPSSNPIQPSKSQIRQLLTQYEQIIQSNLSNGGLSFGGLANLEASLNYPAHTMAWVVQDAASPENTGIYEKIGAPGEGYWTKWLDLPYSFIAGSDTGAGTPNAIQVDTDIPVSPVAIVSFTLFDTTGPGPVTVSFNGGPAVTLKTPRGTTATSLGAGQEIWGRIRLDDSTFRMINDQDVSALVAQAEYWASIAEAAAIPAGTITNEKVYTPSSPDDPDAVDAEKLVFSSFGTPAIPRSVGDKARDYVFIEDQGGGQSKTGAENLAALNRAKAALPAAAGGKGGHLLLRAGAYKTSGKFTLGSQLVIEGMGADISRIVPEFTADDVISIGNGGAVVQHSGVRGVSFEPPNPMTAGAMIRFDNHFSCDIENIRATENIHYGIAINNGETAYIARMNDVFINGGEFGLVCGMEGFYSLQNVFVTNCQFGIQENAGIALFNVSGMFVDDSEVLGARVGLLIYPDAAHTVFALRCGKVFFDTCEDAAAQIFSNGGKVGETTFNNSWFSSTKDANASNVVINGPSADLIKNVTFTGCTSTNARGAGIQIDKASDISITGCDVVTNGQQYYFDSVNRHPGVQILSGAVGVNIVGGKAGKGINFADNFQDYGIAVSAGATDVAITGVDTRGNVSGGVYDPSAVARIHNSMGCRTFDKGQAFFGTGVSSVVVNHGLAFTPTFEDVHVTAAGDMSTSGINSVWATGFTSTQFTIITNTPVTSPIYMVWSARVRQ